MNKNQRFVLLILKIKNFKKLTFLLARIQNICTWGEIRNHRHELLRTIPLLTIIIKLFTIIVIILY